MKPKLGFIWHLCSCRSVACAVEFLGGFESSLEFDFSCLSLFLSGVSLFEGFDGFFGMALSGF